MLKLPQLFENLSDVQALFYTCATFHNMLLDWDDAAFEDGGAHSDHIIGNTIAASRRHPFSVTSELDVTGVGMDGAPPMFFHDGSSESTHYTLRDALSIHYSIVCPIRDRT
jgi:hypothetical protein